MHGMTRRRFFHATLAAAGTAWLGGTTAARAAKKRLPNFIVIFTDDQGYNDLGCFGSPLIKTPCLDRMAREGRRFTDFYSSAPVCTPSRSSLMTGCYSQRISMAEMPRGKNRLGRVLFPDSPGGIHPDEVTLAEALKDRGYATGCIGKWHLGHLPSFLPTRNGFDSYYGIPYSNDMVPSPLMRDEEVIEEPADQATLTERYTAEAVRFIEAHREEPFFLYVPHNMPHTPLHVSEKFAGKSAGGLYGDVIETIDWGVGQILDTVRQLGLAEDTLVIFTSDNGPWYVRGEDGGNATPLRAGKGTTYEGGMRMPCIMWWPKTIPADTVCREVASTMDFLPTFTTLAGGGPPTDRIIDGHNIFPLMTTEDAKSPYEAFYYYAGHKLNAVRSGKWKLKLETTLREEDIYGPMENPGTRIPEALYNLEVDPGEQKSVLDDHPDVVKRLHALAEKARADLGDSRDKTLGKNVRPMALREEDGTLRDWRYGDPWG